VPQEVEPWNMAGTISCADPTARFPCIDNIDININYNDTNDSRPHVPAKDPHIRYNDDHYNTLILIVLYDIDIYDNDTDDSLYIMAPCPCKGHAHQVTVYSSLHYYYVYIT
jgi:hypothetical protein